jgi:hypothetical protein
MPSNTLRYKPGDARLSATVYWRRRFTALLAGFAVFGIVAWALSGALGGGGTGSNAADVGRVGHGHTGGATAGSAANSGAGTAPGAQPASQAEVTPPAAVPLPVRSPGPGRPAPAPAGPASCPQGDVVISLFAARTSYGPDQPAQFDVDVVSTAASSCSFNIGPRYLTLVVMAGKQRMWGSADCAAAPGSFLADLARGVPVSLPLSWYLQTSAPGCPATVTQAAGGSYTATAAGGGVTSNPVTFRLG